jgi:hypothetical protein
MITKELKFAIKIDAKPYKTKVCEKNSYKYKLDADGYVMYEIKYDHYNVYEGCGEKEISRDKTYSIIELTISNNIPLSSLVSKIIVEENLTDEDWGFITNRIIKEYSSERKHKIFDNIQWQNVINNIWSVRRGYVYGYGDIFDIKKGFKGIGYMGGTGVGTNVHNLTLDIVTGVKIKEELYKTLGAMWIAERMRELLDIRQDTVHLREQIEESDVYCVLNAHPDCQYTVNHGRAFGYPVKSFTDKDITCLNCNPNATKKKYVSKVSIDRKLFNELCSKFRDDVLPYVTKEHGWSGSVKGSSKELMAQLEEAKNNYMKRVKVMILNVKQAKVIVKEETARKYLGEFDLTVEYDKAINFIKERHEKIMGVKV